MKATTLESNPLWLEQPHPRYAALKKDLEFDVVVIGGGITGLTAAYLLKKAGQRVAVFEKGEIGCAETGHTTAHLTMVTDARLSELARTFGNIGARLAWLGGRAAIETIDQIRRQEQIECHLQRVPGFLHASIVEDRDETDDLKAEAELARELGFAATFMPQVPLFNKPGIAFANQALFHPFEYLRALAKAVNGDGCEVHQNSEMTEASDDPLSIVVHGHRVRFKQMIIATHVPLQGLKNIVSATLFQTKIAPYSTYAIGATVPRGTVPQASYWDTTDPYYYLRVHPRRNDDYLIFGGEDHKTGQESDPERCYAKLQETLLRYVPAAKVDHRWSGQVIETHDGLPYIGPASDEQFIATGFSGNGMTFGTLSGMMACDWVMKRDNPWQDLLHVTRKKLGGAWDYLTENVDYPYHLVTGFVRATEGKSIDDVAPGEGKILKLGGHRCAVHRTADGEVNVCSAICTHMGCVVDWNNAEKTWDCPCHGSRFTPEGSVIGGPAETPLAKMTADGKEIESTKE